MALRIEPASGGVIITVKVVPNASRPAVAGVLGDALKIKVTKLPERGQANHAVIALLADVLKVSPAHISMVAGHTQPLKRICITGIDAATVHARLMTAINAPRRPPPAR